MLNFGAKYITGIRGTYIFFVVFIFPIDYVILQSPVLCNFQHDISYNCKQSSVMENKAFSGLNNACCVFFNSSICNI